MAGHLLEALVAVQLVCTTLLTRVITVGTQRQDVSQVFPVFASIASEKELLGVFDEQKGYIHASEDTQDQYLHSTSNRGASIPPPGTPTIQTISIAAVLISWTYPPNLPSPIYFYVQCSIDGDPFVNVSGPIPYTGVTSSYVYHDLRFQAFYQFQVVASYGGESSDPSGTSNAFINGVTAPSGPPTAIRVIKISSTDADLVWMRPQFPVFASFIYTLYWGTARNELEQSGIIGDVTSTTISNLRPNTTYFFGMVTMLSGFPSVLSDIINATTAFPTLEKVSIESIKASQSWVWLQWSTPPASPYLVLADQYTILYSQATEAQPHLVTLSGLIQSTTVFGLDQETEYKFWVSYTSGGFTSPLSDPSIVSTLKGPVCTACKPISPSSLLVEWKNPSVTNETLILSEVVGNVSTILAILPIQGNGSCVVSDLLAYTQHQFSIGLGSSHSCCPLEDCRTIQQAPSGPPIDISTAVLNWSSVEVKWNPPLPAQQNGIITSYLVEVVLVDSAFDAREVSRLLQAPHSNIQTLNVSELCVQVAGLQPFSSYAFVVTAGTVAGLGPGSSPVLVSAQQLASYLVVDVGFKAIAHGGTASAPCCHVVLAWSSEITFPVGVVNPQRIVVGEYALSYSSGADSNGTVVVAGDSTEFSLGSNVLQDSMVYSITLTIEGQFNERRLNFTSGSVNVTCPNCVGSQVQVWLVAVSSVIGILLLVTLLVIPMTIYCWIKHHWKRRPSPHYYLMDDHMRSGDAPPMSDLCPVDTPPLSVQRCTDDYCTPDDAIDQRVVVGGPSEASPSTPDNTSVASDDELAEPLLGCQHIPSVPLLTGRAHESTTSDSLNSHEYQLHDILMGTRYAPEGCSSSSSNSSASISDIMSN